MPNPNPNPNPREPAPTSASSKPTQPAEPYPAALPSHHHHHHHRLPFGGREYAGSPAGPGSTPSAPAQRPAESGAPSERERRDAELRGRSGLPSSAGAGVRESITPTGLGSSSSAPGGFSRGFGGYGIFGTGFREQDIRERERREREQRERQARESESRDTKAAARPGDAASAYSRQGMPPSPTARTHGVSAAPAANPSRPSTSPKPAASALPGSQNRGPTISGYGLGPRPLPSPFGDRDRERSSAQIQEPQHRRTGSTSSIDPARQRSIFDTNAPPTSQASREGSTQRSPVARTNTVTPSGQEAAREPTATSPKQAAAPQRYTYGNFGYGGYQYGQYRGVWPDGTSGSGSASWLADKERERYDRQKAEEQQRKALLEKREKEDRDRREKERERMLAQRDRETQRQQIEVKPFMPPRQSHIQPRAYDKPAADHRIEVLNQAPSSASAASSDPGRDSVMQQVAPQREPRPYNYTAKPDPSLQPPLPQVQPINRQEKDYVYTPREKRPRMDAAVEDAHRRGSATKAKRRKEEDRTRSPPRQTRDFSALTKAKKTYPDVSSQAVENWLKTVPDDQKSRMVGSFTYPGPDWCLAAQSELKDRLNEGAVVKLRINGSFFGRNWVIKGGLGGSVATPVPPPGATMAREYDLRKVWGTDVYTDDSDICSVLIHSGWLSWAPDTEAPIGTSDDGDTAELRIRIVPRLVRYPATERHGLVSRSWGNGHDGFSIMIEDVKRVKASIPQVRQKYVADAPQVEKNSLSGLKGRKLRMAEMARQRAAVLGLPVLPVPDELEQSQVDTGGDGVLSWTKDRVG